jgi:outer membrane receptor for ferrienterochelin and colicins
MTRICRWMILFFFLFQADTVLAQSTVTIKLVDEETEQPVSGTIVSETASHAVDSTGMITITFSSSGVYKLFVSAAGYAQHEVDVVIPDASGTFVVRLAREEEELEEVIVQSTRTSRTIANVPTRVETIEFEEIDEKSNMRPANVAMILHESTGIQVQQTSATSANASIRIQGLDGRYTQLLRDGFPNFGNFASGLSVLEIPPLDLRQVEIIKGPASPLFGGGAIAGVINFITKTPGDKPEYNFLINQSNIGQTNVGTFLSRRSKNIGFTLLALYNKQKAYDVDKDDFTETPDSDELTINSKLFLYPKDHTTIIIGNNFTHGNRLGGDLQVVKGEPGGEHQYFERNKTNRYSSSFEIERRVGAKNRFLLKQSFATFDRQIEIPSYRFTGIERNTFTDASYLINAANYSLVFGGNFIYNDFKERAGSVRRDNISRTTGLYGQHTWDASEKVKLETGIRVDVAAYNNPVYSKTEYFVLPRLSLLIRYTKSLSSRIGGGIGYKLPSLFTEETETIQYRNVNQLNDVVSERSYGGTADINFRTLLAEGLQFSLNHMFFYTTITKPLVLQSDVAGNLSFVNAQRSAESIGFETNAKLILKNNFKLFLGYTFTDAKANYQIRQQFLSLVPKHKLNSALIYEKEDFIKLGLEGYFTGTQYLSNGSRTPAFSEFGFMAEKIFKKFSIYINFENFADTRQSRFENVVNGPHANPTFDEIWTHTEGFVFNGGIKLRL